MSRASTLLRRLGRDRSGVTIVEFGFIAAPLVLVLLGTIDLGYRAYAAAVVQGAVQGAARQATIGDKTSAQIDTWVKNQVKVFDPNPTIVKKSYSTFTKVKQLEKITSDTYPIGTYNAGYVRADGTIVNGDCYDDVNNNWKRDDMGATGLGNADEIVYYEVTVSWNSFLPMRGLLGWDSKESVTANTVLRNQPYAANTPATPPNRCYEK